MDLHLTHDEYELFKNFVLERSGLYFPEYKQQNLTAGIGKTLTTLGLGSDTRALYDLITEQHTTAGRDALDCLLRNLTVGETHFFRDDAQFNGLTQKVLPGLIARKRAMAEAMGPDIAPQLRVWSAGCSSGEEPYSLAIALKELIPDLERWRILILGTDINADSLNRAREASYTEWSFREPKAKAMKPLYFKYDWPTKRYHLREDIKAMVTFAQLNLAEADFPATHNNTLGMDLIMCRNVTIYFSHIITQRIIERFHQTLVQEGWLVVGHSEAAALLYHLFQPHTLFGTLLYQKASQLPKLARPKFDVPVVPKTPPVALEITKPDEPKQASVVEATTEDRHEPKTNDYYLAKDLLKSGRTEAAISALKRQITLTPQFAPAYSLLCRAYANLGAWNEARKAGLRAIELDSLLSDTYYTLALVYEQEQQPEWAIDMLKKVIYLDREAPLPYLNLAVLYKKLGQRDAARRTIASLVKLLRRWRPEQVVPDSGGSMAKHLLKTAEQIQAELLE